MDARYARLKSEGRCVTCGKPAAPKVIGEGLGIYCEDHQRRNQKKAYDAMHALPDEERRRIHREGHKRFMKNHPGYTTKYGCRGKYDPEKYREHAARCRRDGLCVTCEKPAALKKDGTRAVYCDVHLRYRRERYRRVRSQSP
jgi:hypothetical protein